MRLTLTRRGASLDPGIVLDTGIAIVGAALTAIAAWVPPSVSGAAAAGPPWLRAVLPLLIGAPLVMRRRAPLLMWTVTWVGISLQTLITGHQPQGPGLVFVLFVGSYSLAAHSSLRRAVAGLAVMAPGVAIYLHAGHAGGESLIVHDIVGGQLPGASPFFAGEVLALWLAGLFVRARKQAASLTARNATLQRQAERAVVAERARIARELHDIVAHHLSVVVLQAAGARALREPASGTLEKIEHSGRQALTEMRRLLDVLREPQEEPALTPQPGIGELAALAGNVRAAGLPVRLVVDGDHAALPAAVDVSVYRIVQEALTNVLKHAGPAHAEVAVGCAPDAVTIEVTDDGAGIQALGAQAGGSGLAGIRERVAIFGGQLLAGPRPGGGFAVRARLPFGDGTP
jgi:signal transduction histidine kinase